MMMSVTQPFWPELGAIVVATKKPLPDCKETPLGPDVGWVWRGGAA